MAIDRAVLPRGSMQSMLKSSLSLQLIKMVTAVQARGSMQSLLKSSFTTNVSILYILYMVYSEREAAIWELTVKVN